MEIEFIIIESSSVEKEEGISVVESIDDTKDVVSVISKITVSNF